MQTNTPKPRNFDPLRFSPPRDPPAEALKKIEEERGLLIAKAAYFRAERRGFSPGHEVEDWLAAEAEVDLQAAEARKRRSL